MPPLKSLTMPAKGGSVTLAAGADINGNANPTAVVDVRTGSTIDLSVAANTASQRKSRRFYGDAGDSGASNDRWNRRTSGADRWKPLPARRPSSSKDIGSTTSLRAREITRPGKSDLQRWRELPGGRGTHDAHFYRDDEPARGRFGLPIYIETGAEIINQSGNLTLGTPTSNSSSDWDLENYRFGPDGTAGQ